MPGGLLAWRSITEFTYPVFVARRAEHLYPC
uniref:Uncharacterized protein n=1 Tax=mine drainage metagenome TaxID=410659 RepID=E6QLQ7_9ZZZZ